MSWKSTIETNEIGGRVRLLFDFWCEQTETRSARKKGTEIADGYDNSGHHHKCGRCPFVRSNPGPPVEVKSLFEAIRLEVGNAIQPHGEEQSCIAVCGLLTHVLRGIGYPAAYPLTVRVSIYTRQTHDWIKRHGLPKNVAEWDEFNRAGCVHAYIGYTPTQMLPPNHWGGHLAVVVPELFGSRHGFVDFTITQANRPEMGIVLTPIVLKVPHAFVSGAETASVWVGNCHVVYESFPSDHTFNDRGDWQQSPKLQSMASLIIDSLKAKGIISHRRIADLERGSA